MPGPASKILNAFTVDVEDYYHVSGFERWIRREQWDGFESRVVSNTRRVLELLDRFGVKATFFVLGWVARRHPEIVREIHRCGHEIGSHGFWHRLIYRQSPEDFRKDLCESRRVLEDIIDEEVIAYRAPSFSITSQSRWAIDILVQEGFRIDSSVYPIRHDRYGMPGASREVHRITSPSGTICEFPPSVAKLAGFRVPVGGGGYFRLYPLPWTCRLLQQINNIEGWPFLIFIHPWEVDPGQPRIREASALARFRHYVNLSGTERKLESLLSRFRFGPLRDVIAHLTHRESAEVAKCA
jgi:polysaccharide deacetylase family protein (PEP-CTERM system associated)